MDTILRSVKNHLKITWDYQDDEIIEMIIEGQDALRGYFGDCEFEGAVLTLLKEWCRYYWSGAISLFSKSYQREILQLQLRFGVSNNGY